MFVCVCKAVTERKIEALVREGACNLRDISQCTGLGSVCGRCVPETRALIEATRSTHPALRIDPAHGLPPASALAATG